MSYSLAGNINLIKFPFWYNVKLYAKTITLIIIPAIVTGTVYNYLQENIDIELSMS